MDNTVKTNKNSYVNTFFRELVARDKLKTVQLSFQRSRTYKGRTIITLVLTLSPVEDGYWMAFFRQLVGGKGTEFHRKEPNRWFGASVNLSTLFNELRINTCQCLSLYSCVFCPQRRILEGCIPFLIFLRMLISSTQPKNCKSERSLHLSINGLVSSIAVDWFHLVSTRNFRSFPNRMRNA